MQNATQPRNKTFLFALLFLMLTYFTFEWLMIPLIYICPDELWFGQHIYRYLHEWPFRDFIPYKTVLGYYLLTLPFHFFHQTAQFLYYIRDEVAILNVIFLLVIGCYATRHFSRSAILLTLVLIFSQEFFLSLSAQLRVDLQAAWICLFSALLLLEKRGWIAGVLIGVAFLVSQKALWYIEGSVVTLVLFCFMPQAIAWRRCTARYMLGLAIPVIIYLLVAVSMSSWSAVYVASFRDAYYQTQLNWYHAALPYFWIVILYHCPLLILLLPQCFLALSVSHGTGPKSEKKDFIVTYATASLLFYLPYRSNFSYNFIMMVPVLFLLYADFFMWLLPILFKQRIQLTLHVAQSTYIALTLFITCLIVGIVIAVGLNRDYLMIAGLPIFIMGLVFREEMLAWLNVRLPALSRQYVDLLSIMIVMGLTITGVVMPIIHFTALFLDNEFDNGSYQRANIAVARELLASGGEYFAGTPLIFEKPQSIAGLKNLLGPQVDYFYHPEKAAQVFLFASNDMMPRTIDEITNDIENKPIKFYIDNYRIQHLPPRLKAFLNTQFIHYWGSIFLYAPIVSNGKQAITIKFKGNYCVIASSPQALMSINGIALKPGMMLHLTAKQYQSQASDDYRLVYQPDLQIKLALAYQANRWLSVVGNGM